MQQGLFRRQDNQRAFVAAVARDFATFLKQRLHLRFAGSHQDSVLKIQTDPRFFFKRVNIDFNIAATDARSVAIIRVVGRQAIIRLA